MPHVVAARLSDTTLIMSAHAGEAYACAQGACLRTQQWFSAKIVMLVSRSLEWSASGAT